MQILLLALFASLAPQDSPELFLGTFDRPEDARLWKAAAARR